MECVLKAWRVHTGQWPLPAPPSWHCLPTGSRRQGTWSLVSAEALLLRSTLVRDTALPAASASHSALIWVQELPSTVTLQIGAKQTRHHSSPSSDIVETLQGVKSALVSPALAFVDSTNLRSTIFGENNPKKSQNNEAELATHWAHADEAMCML